MSASRKAAAKNTVGLSTDAVRANGAAFAGIWPCTVTRDDPGRRCSVSRPAPIFANRHQPVVDLQAAAFWAHLNGNRIARRGAGANDEIDRALVVGQRAHRRRISVRQVVERPAVAQALVIEEVVVADDAAFDSRDARLAYLSCHHPQRVWLLAAFADAGIAAADDRRDRRAATPSSTGAAVTTRVSNRWSQPRRSAGRRCRDDLHRRARHHELAGVQLEQVVGRSSRTDEHAPE